MSCMLPSCTDAYPWLGRGGNEWGAKSQRSSSQMSEKEFDEMFGIEESPFEDLYFSEENMNRYEPLAEASKIYKKNPEDDQAEAEFSKALNEYRDTSWCSNWDYKKYDIVFYGASGYTGYLMLMYLKTQALPHSKENFTFALAGRTYSKVEAVRDRVFAGTQYADVPILTANLEKKWEDLVSMIDLAKSARVLVNVAGPYMLTPGEVLVDCCVYHKTDYIDVAGEVPHMLKLYKLHERAKEAGVLVCGSSGVAAIADMGMNVCAKKIREDYGEEVRRGKGFFSMGGTENIGSSGGTLATRKALNEADEEVKAAMQDPFSFGGYIEDRFLPENGLTDGRKTVFVKDGELKEKIRREDTDFVLSQVHYNEVAGSWCAPWWFAYFETRMVRRSNMLMRDLLGQPYGAEFNYQEYMISKDEASAKAGMKRGVNVAEEKEALKKKGMYYEQGEGPSLEAITEAYTHFRFHAETASGKSFKWSITGKDGYYETARMAIELALTLRFDRLSLDLKGGCLTSSVAGGSHLQKRIAASGVVMTMGSWESIPGLPNDPDSPPPDE